MERRKFIISAVAAAAVVAVPLIRCNCTPSLLDQPLCRPDVLAHICDEKEIRAIGRSYRELVPSENSKQTLIDLLLVDETGKKTELKEKTALFAWLEKKAQADFKSHRTLITRGWVLSQTEARQCALFTFFS